MTLLHLRGRTLISQALIVRIILCQNFYVLRLSFIKDWNLWDPRHLHFWEENLSTQLLMIFFYFVLWLEVVDSHNFLEELSPDLSTLRPS